MKIMLFYYGILIESKGGLEKVFCSMANELVERGYEVAAVGFDNRKDGMPGFPLSHKVNFVNIGANVKNKLTLWQRLRRSLIFDRDKRYSFGNSCLDKIIINKFNRIVEAENPDIIISYDAKTTRIIKKSQSVKVPVISMVHSSPGAWFAKADKETKAYFAMSDCIQVLMPDFKQELSRYVENNNVVVIGNVVPQVECVCNYESKLIINIARFGKEKQLDLLIKAFAKCSDKYRDWQVQFYGGAVPNGNFEYCQELVKKLHLGNHVHFCGTTDNVFEKLEQASIFAFPSAFEGFSLALTEAMSVGLPCIGYKSCSAVNKHIINGENGILCDDGVDALAAALMELMDDEEKRRQYGQQAKCIMKKYAPNIIWDEWEALINKTVAEYGEKER